MKAYKFSKEKMMDALKSVLPIPLDTYVDRLKNTNDEIKLHGITYISEATKYLRNETIYEQVYDWDLYFESIYSTYVGEKGFWHNNIEEFFSRQHENGFIPRAFGNEIWGKNDPFKPFMAQIILLGCRQSENYDFAEKHFVHLEHYLQNYREFYDADQNGLCHWLEAGATMDNQHSRVPSDASGEGVDLNCYLACEYDAMEQLARRIGLPAKAGVYKSLSNKIKQQINRCLWDEDEGIYYDRNEKTGDLIKVKGVSCFMPLWAGVASKGQAERLVYEHLTNPKEFWPAYPITTLAMTEPYYNQDYDISYCNWNGSTWMPMNYMVFQGLRRYGEHEIAKELAVRCFDMVMIKNSSTREFYNSDTAEGYGCDPFPGWSSLGYFMLLELALDYNPTDYNQQLIPVGRILGAGW